MKTWATLILSGLLLSAHASAEVLEKKGCGSCHQLNNKETGNSFSAPDLHYAGNKFQPEWLKQFLKNPEVIRPAGFINDPRLLQTEKLPPHPSFKEEEVNILVKDLMSLKISNLAPVDLKPLSKGLYAKVKYQFERTFGCISCHQSLNLTGRIRGGISGPSLVNAGNRLQGNWIADWLNKPATYILKGRMPRYKMDSTTLDQFTRFLMMLKKENIK